jgi:hypothetical protein
MRNLWASSAASLLDVLSEVRGGPSDTVLSRLSQGRIGTAGPSWPAVLTRLRGIEAALLQDVTWWGPLMEERLHRWDIEGDVSSERHGVPQDTSPGNRLRRTEGCSG